MSFSKGVQARVKLTERTSREWGDYDGCPRKFEGRVIHETPQTVRVYAEGYGEVWVSRLDVISITEPLGDLALTRLAMKRGREKLRESQNKALALVIKRDTSLSYRVAGSVCHGFMSSAGAGVEKVITYPNSKMWNKKHRHGLKYGKQYLSYLIKRSPFRSVFLTKNLEKGLANGFVMDHTAPANFLQAALIATRLPQERQEQAQAWCMFVARGVPENLAFVLAHTVWKEWPSTGWDNKQGCGQHWAINPRSWSKEILESFCNDTDPVHLNPPYHIGTSYSGVFKLWARDASTNNPTWLSRKLDGIQGSVRTHQRVMTTWGQPDRVKIVYFFKSITEIVNKTTAMARAELPEMFNA